MPLNVALSIVRHNKGAGDRGQRRAPCNSGTVYSWTHLITVGTVYNWEQNRLQLWKGKGRHSSGEELTVFRSSPSREAYPFSKGYTILRHWAYLVFLGEPFPRHWHPPYTLFIYHMVYKGCYSTGGYYEGGVGMSGGYKLCGWMVLWVDGFVGAILVMGVCLSYGQNVCETG